MRSSTCDQNSKTLGPRFGRCPARTVTLISSILEGKFNFSFSIGACQRQRSHLAKRTAFILARRHSIRSGKNIEDRVSFHIVNGDYSYEETLERYSAAGIENNYKLYLERGRSLGRLLRYVPMMTMYNDHEVTDNIDGSGEVGLGDGNLPCT